MPMPMLPIEIILHLFLFAVSDPNVILDSPISFFLFLPLREEKKKGDFSVFLQFSTFQAIGMQKEFGAQSKSRTISANKKIRKSDYDFLMDKEQLEMIQSYSQSESVLTHLHPWRFFSCDSWSSFSVFRSSCLSSKYLFMDDAREAAFCGYSFLESIVLNSCNDHKIVLESVMK